MKRLKISEITADPTLNIALDTLQNNKQALIFLSTKPSAEKVAEEISKKIKTEDAELEKLSLDALHSLSKPTKQCERLGRCIRKGIAFHHAGLTQSQRELIETNFRSGKIKIICCTPTLAYGVDLPAYRSIIRDLKRYSVHGMDWIPVLEYLQMAGRAGRPSFDKNGEAIVISVSKGDKKRIYEKYLLGEPEEIYSKLAVEPVLRTYILSVIASNFTNTEKEILNFFEKTFWAYQFQDLEALNAIIIKMLNLLEEWEFIKIGLKDEFQSASELKKDKRISATLLGKRVSELYLDPLTAHKLILGIRKASGRRISSFAVLQLISSALELRPLLSVKMREYDDVQDKLMKHSDELLMEEPSLYEPEYEDFLNSIKTAYFFEEWMEEKEEEYLLEKFQIRPGEIKMKLEIADWLLYSLEEISRILQFKELIREFIKLRLRMRYGVREELLTLIRLKNIGRVRARKLHAHGLRDIGDIKKADINILIGILGKGIAEDIKKQVGQEIKEIQEKLEDKE